MSGHARILVLDDLANWRELLELVLRRAGYEVDAVASLQEALKKLQEELYHLVIVDIRLQDADEKNVEGMSFLDQLEHLGLSTALEVIVLSAYGTMEQMREAFRDHRIRDFVSKEHFDNSEFLETVDRIFEERIRVNFDLQIQLEDDLSYPELVSGLVLRGERVQDGGPFARRAAKELVDLFRRLFYKADSVVVSGLSTPGRSGSRVVHVQPFYPDMIGQPVVVKYGDPQEIDREYRHYDSFVKDAVGRATNLTMLRRTPLLGGAVYSFVGTGTEPVQQFAAYYRDAKLADVEAVLDDVFRVTCANWYRDRGRVRPLSLTEEYRTMVGLTDEKLERALEDNYRSFLGREKIQFRDVPDRVFVNPVYAIRGKNLRRNTYRCITHGDLNAGNIMVDTDCHAWVIDFHRTGPGHVLRDCIELEVETKFVLLDSKDLAARAVLEHVLTTPDHFSEMGNIRYQAPDPALEKAFATVMKLRQLAQDFVQPSDDLSEYYIGLLYMSLNMIRWYRLPRVNQLHAFIAASLLCERLNL